MTTWPDDYLPMGVYVTEAYVHPRNWAGEIRCELRVDLRSDKETSDGGWLREGEVRCGSCGVKCEVKLLLDEPCSDARCEEITSHSLRGFGWSCQDDSDKDYCAMCISERLER